MTNKMPFAVVAFISIHAATICGSEPERPPLFPPDQSIPVAKSLFGGQIGRAEGYRSNVVGVANVFGHGPYDLFLLPDRMFPFRGFTADGAPEYAAPIQLKGVPVGNIVFNGPNGRTISIALGGRRVQVNLWDPERREFQRHATSPQLEVAGGFGGGTAAFVDGAGKLHVYASVSLGMGYRPPGDHHAASYMPYDGAGFWRGEIPRRRLVHVRFDSLELNTVEAINEIGDGPGQFLFSVGGMAVVHLGQDRAPGLITCEKLGIFRYFPLDPQTGKPGPQQFVNNEQHVAFRHHVINPSVKAIADPKTGLSNLMVGDSGRIWFYPFTGKFSENGSPIYGSPQPVFAEDAHLSLGELPVINAGDVDGDGLVDIVAGNDGGELLFVKNIGKADRPEFANPVAASVGGRPLDIKAGYRGSIQGPGEGHWGYTCPTLCDWNGDGKLDVILNSIMADYMLLLQEKSADGVPQFSEPQHMYCDGMQLHLAWRSQPAITDWGTGGRLCMIALDEKNLLRRFWRIDNLNVERGELLRLENGSPITANVDEAAGQTGRAKLVPHDFDEDGDIDLLIGTSRGLSFPAGKGMYLPSHYDATRQASVLLLRNVGSNAEPVFDYVKQLDYNGERIGLGIHSCSPAPVDLGRGVIDLLVGEEMGSIHYYPRESLGVSSPAD